MITAVVIQLPDGTGLLVRVTDEHEVHVDQRPNQHASWSPIEVVNGRNVHGSGPVYRVELQK